jgi:predicted nucleotidyltransferase
LFRINLLHLIMLEIEKYRSLILPILKRHLVKRAAIFGSIAKGNQTATSDIDILIEADSNFTMFKLLSLEEELSKKTNRKVDIVEYGVIKPSIKQEILQSAISIL